MTFPFKKHEIFGGVAHVSHMARKQNAGFFSDAQEVKGCEFL